MDGRIKSGHDGVVVAEEEHEEPGSARVEGQTGHPWIKSGHDGWGWTGGLSPIMAMGGRDRPPALGYAALPLLRVRESPNGALLPGRRGSAVSRDRP